MSITQSQRYLPFLLGFCLSFLCIDTAASASSTPWGTPHFTIEPKALYTQASEVTPAEGISLTVLADEESYSFDSAGRVLFTQYAVYKVRTQKIPQGWDTISAQWEPWHQERPTIRARVLGPDGSVHELDTKTLADEPAQEQGSDVFSDRRVIRGPLPAVESGSVVEEEIAIQETAPAFAAGTVARGFFGRIAVPVQHSRLTVDAPAALPLHYITQLLPDLQPQRTESDGRVRLVFEHGPLDALEDAESNLSADVPAYPYIAFSTGASWQQVALEYSAAVESRIADGDIGPSIQKLTQPGQARKVKIEEIVSYLNKEVRYTGIQFGSASIIPHSPAETLTRRYGDCKDKSALLVAMLRAAGVPAYLALLRAGGRMDVPSELPGFGLFDHAIVYAPGAPDFWIDATDDYARLGELPVADQDRLALVIRRETTALIRTPAETSADNLLSEFREIHLADYGPARIVERSQPHGSTESSYRRAYADAKDKSVKESLTNYVKSEYVAANLDRLDRSDTHDFSHQFELVLESKSSRRGFTDLGIAAAAIRWEGLFYRLPAELQQREKVDDKRTDEKKQKTKRTVDYLLPEAFATEWHYTISPPAGFQLKPLPMNMKRQLGPCTLTVEFSSEPDNTVHADLTFDTIKRRFTIAEANELRDKIVELEQGQPLMFYFEPKGQALVNEGKIREGLHSYRELIALNPKEAIHHLRLAKALLEAGLAEAARDEARTAVKLEPNSALAEKTLAEILEYDLVGRKFRPGSDYPGAEAAFREAVRLDPEDKATVGNLSILLEYNRWGLRYGPGAKLKDAVAEYRKLTIEQQAELGIQNNIAFALFYAGDFKEAKKAAESLSSPPAALIVACEAAQNGFTAAVADARKLTAGDEPFKEAAKTAGEMLENVREYSLAADLKEAGASGDNASDLQAEAALLRRTKRHEQIQFADDPSGTAVRFDLLTVDPDLKLEQLHAISSKNGASVLAVANVREYTATSQRKTISEKARQGIFADVGVDLSVTRAQPSVQGNDSIGYKVTLWPSASYKTAIYVVMEEGHYKVLGTSTFYAGIGLEVLDRIAANDLPGARALLDWLREDQHLAGGDDPIAGLPFPRLWTKGKEADASRIKTAAAAILVMAETTAAKGAEILEAARHFATTDSEKTSITLALATAYDRLHQYEKLLAMTSELSDQFPESDIAFTRRTYSLGALGRLQELDNLAEERRKRIPGDPIATRQLAFSAAQRGDYAKAHSLHQQIVNDGHGDVSDMNQLAWYALYMKEPSDSDLDYALKGAQLSNNSWGVLHTLGCIYAELGKTKEAREVLLQAMDSGKFAEPDPNFWYAFGRIAEQAGEDSSARADYARVTKPEDPVGLPTSSYRLAQMRLEVMQRSAK